MAGWHHRLDGHEFEQTAGDGDGQGGLACYCPWGHKESDRTERLNRTDLSVRHTSTFTESFWMTSIKCLLPAARYPVHPSRECTWDRIREFAEDWVDFILLPQCCLAVWPQEAKLTYLCFFILTCNLRVARVVMRIKRMPIKCLKQCPAAVNIS